MLEEEVERLKKELQELQIEKYALYLNLSKKYK